MDHNQRALEPIPGYSEQFQQLEEEMLLAQEELRTAEAELAQEQAAVNAFRMHCRLQLGSWIEEVLDLRTEKQRLLTRLSFLEQAAETDLPPDREAWYFQEDGAPEETLPPLEDGYELPLPELPNDRKAEKRLYRELARRFHPDVAENSFQRAYATSMMAAINDAYGSHDLQALRDFAGELDPEIATEIGVSPQHGRQFKTLQKRLRKCRQRRRKVTYQLNLLRQENTSKLWRKAHQVENEPGSNWWDEVAMTLQDDIDRTRVEIDQLNGKIRAALEANQADS